MKSTGSFEENLKSVDEIIRQMENGELSLDDSIKAYEKAMKLLKASSDLLNQAEGKVLKVIEKNNGDIEVEEV
ncbi:Exodeoxyribonuclease 7 small subunit [Fusobacterium sp. DD29]|uniref:exodeoxyribonuclease VII small subunit n=1 Tax=unclassified Fusobacterium TaxID=2648384 RepID=UPI001B8B54AE|nr:MULTISPECIES: exodeoxyribonuclease VII small subunit [unclassified Fusobacterium]MBR8700571.1 Exodeoxyribonuclease 7 small subunit [Fusobacterium sp. DD45]MBR8710320.1 Exodeoxyribonuclease 7 small subunit [Fusobacterium sp. DD28]MBR8749282.1 Exodeoxyribonuclease 7 small subunit [Fusobacterium sp. DD29]MBR8750794.1 Exodeoxyribonuclease 7 small subunit [Fusobacterium sp. DD26]MBR8761548.1 Exodeoxyribonuclease 7 small subunit [Fusobacterium sp. DD25]